MNNTPLLTSLETPTLLPDAAPLSGPIPRQVALSAAQDLALEWLTSGGSISEAAQFAGVCRQTVSRWLSTDPDFRAVYDAWREQISIFTEGQLHALTEPAISALANAIRTHHDVRAAQFVLKHLAEINRRK